MGKASMCIQMLQILNSGRVYKVSELAGFLDTNPRNIIEYKREIEECGYYINTIPGRYGGYQLDKSKVIPSLNFLPNELRALDLASEYLLKRKDFLDKEEYQKAMAKVFSSTTKTPFDNDILIINRFPLAMSQEELKKRFDIIYDAIRLRKCLKLKYVSQKNVEYEYIYHPYEIFMYNNSWFVIGWNEYFKDIIYFKINRITEIKMLDKSFSVARFYNRSDYISEFGFKDQEQEYYHLKFIAKGVNASIVKERIYGKNQVITPIDESQTMVEVDMKGKGRIFDFVLGYQENIDLIEPQWLKDMLKDFGEYLIKTYSGKDKRDDEKN